MSRKLIIDCLITCIILVIAFAMAATSKAAPDNIIIRNNLLKLVVKPQQNIFQLINRQNGKIFSCEGKFAYDIRSGQKKPIRNRLWGNGTQITIRHNNGWITTLRLYTGNPFLYLRTTAYNPTREIYVSACENIFSVDINLGIPAEKLNSLGTGFLHPVNKAPGSFTYTAIACPESRQGIVAACLTHDHGSGVFFTDVNNNLPRVRVRLDFGRFQVDPGQYRPTETILLGFFEDARFGLERYADYVAKQYHIKLKPQPCVYCTWYHAGASNEIKLLNNADFARQHLKPFGFSVIQIDDHWQAKFPKNNHYTKQQKNFKGIGPVKTFFAANSNFPSGMKYTAQKIRSLGLVPGIWFMPFAGTFNNPYFADKQDLFAHWPDGSAVTTRWSGTLLDLTNPKTQVFVRNRVKRIYDWGYEYFKLDGMHTGAVTHNVYVNSAYATTGHWVNTRNFVGEKDAPGTIDSPTPSTVLHDPRMTHIEAYRKGLEIVRQAAPNAFILGCCISQNMRSMGAAFGLIDAMRIGPDNGGAGRGHWKSVMAGPNHGTNLYFLNNRIWHNDPDPVYVRPTISLTAARLMASWVAISGSMLSTSYQFSELPAERLDILKRCMPGHNAIARPVDIFESDTAHIWLLSDTSRNVARNVIGLFNWNEKGSDTITCDMKKLGLNDKTTYVAFDYWADKFIEPIRGILKQTLPAGTCRILAVRPVADHPQLLGTSRHITQGIIDILEEHWDPATKTISGKSIITGNDPYEMRIALPESGSWSILQASADKAIIKSINATSRGVRILLQSPENRIVTWRIRWKSSP